MKVVKICLYFIVIVGLYFIYPYIQVSNPQYSSFYGNIEDFNLKGKDCLVEFNAESISFVSKDFRIDHVRNITIESNGKKQLINYSSSIVVKNYEGYKTPLSVGNVHVDIFLENLTLRKYFPNSVKLNGDMRNDYESKFKPKNGKREVVIAKHWGVDYLSIVNETSGSGTSITDFKIISFELDDSSNITFYSENISLIANGVSDFEILKSLESQMLEMTLTQGEGTLHLDEHLFEIKGSNELNIVILPLPQESHQERGLYIDNTKARFYGLTNFARLNTEDIIFSPVEYWIKREPEKLNAYAVVILVFFTGLYARSTYIALNDQRKNRKIAAIDKKLENVYSPMNNALIKFNSHLKSSSENEIPGCYNKLLDLLNGELLNINREYGHLLDPNIRKCCKKFRELSQEFKQQCERGDEKVDTFYANLNDLIKNFHAEVKGNIKKEKELRINLQS